MVSRCHADDDKVQRCCYDNHQWADVCEKQPLDLQKDWVDPKPDPKLQGIEAQTSFTTSLFVWVSTSAQLNKLSCLDVNIYHQARLTPGVQPNLRLLNEQFPKLHCQVEDSENELWTNRSTWRNADMGRTSNSPPPVLESKRANYSKPHGANKITGLA